MYYTGANGQIGMIWAFLGLLGSAAVHSRWEVFFVLIVCGASECWVIRFCSMDWPFILLFSLVAWWFEGWFSGVVMHKIYLRSFEHVALMCCLLDADVVAASGHDKIHWIAGWA